MHCSHILKNVRDYLVKEAHTNNLFSTTDISVHPDIFSHTLCLYSHISFSEPFVRYSEMTVIALVVLAVLLYLNMETNLRAKALGVRVGNHISLT